MDSDHIGESSEIVQQTVLVGNIRFNVPAIRGDGHEPVLPIIFQQIHIGEHGRRILCAESDHVHNCRIKAVAADLALIIWVTDTDITFFQSVGEPFRVKGRDVGPLPGVDDHSASPPISFLNKSFCEYHIVYLIYISPDYRITDVFKM